MDNNNKQKFIDLGYEDDLYKLNTLSDLEKNDLIASLKAFPGHKAKMAGLFQVIKDVIIWLLL